MLRRVAAWLYVSLFVFGAGLVPAVAQASAGSGLTVHPHVFWIMMENQGYTAASTQPYAATLMKQYAYADTLASAHPSLPNYLALTSGQTLAAHDYPGVTYDAPNVVDQLEAAGISWGAYAEDLPSVGYLGGDSGLYSQHHFPLVYYNDIRDNSARTAHLQPLSVLTPLLQGPASGVSDYTWITPNLIDDGHNSGAAGGDQWLSTFVPQILASPAWQQGGTLIITWDEGEGAEYSPAGGHVLTLVVSPHTQGLGDLGSSYTAYGLLRSLEQAWNLPYLGQATTATAIPQMVSALTPQTVGCSAAAPLGAVFGSPGATVQIGSGTLTVTGQGGSGRVGLYRFGEECYVPAVVPNDSGGPPPTFTGLSFSWCGWGDASFQWQPRGGAAQPMPNPSYDATTGCVTSVINATTDPPLADYVISSD